MEEPVESLEPKSEKISRKNGKNGKNGNGNGKKPYSDFLELIEKYNENSVIGIFTHPGPDPDAISSMMALAWLIRKVTGHDTKLFYIGEISHPQNNSMVNLLSPDIKKFNNSDSCDLAILVDTIPNHSGTTIDFNVVIDHHREIPDDFEGVLIHRKCGSCAAIVYDMICEILGENCFDKEVDADSKVATALIAGIMTDTHFLLSDDSTELDRQAFNGLFEHRNASFLNEIVFFKRRKFWIDKKSVACSEAEIDDEGCSIVGLGLIPEKERDLIPDMADDMVSWANVVTSIAFGVVGGDRIEGSVRSTNSSLNVSEFCKKLGGIHGTGGGKLGKGAYQLPLAGFSIDPDEDEQDALEAWEAIKKREIKRIARIIES
jgi:nanoRNase/pAp phosphatase (c-di-AMP/oligoRNAs hydrolase)